MKIESFLSFPKSFLLKFDARVNSFRFSWWPPTKGAALILRAFTFFQNTQWHSSFPPFRPCTAQMSKNEQMKMSNFLFADNGRNRQVSRSWTWIIPSDPSQVQYSIRIPDLLNFTQLSIHRIQYFNNRREISIQNHANSITLERFINKNIYFQSFSSFLRFLCRLISQQSQISPN
jgi:hypothetical protein